MHLSDDKKPRDVIVASHHEFIDAFARPNLIVDGLIVPIGLMSAHWTTWHGHAPAMLPSRNEVRSSWFANDSQPLKEKHI
jgi:hypothetical protein